MRAVYDSKVLRRFGVVLLLILALTALNSYWSINTMKQLETFKEKLEQLENAHDVVEQSVRITQNAVETVQADVEADIGRLKSALGEVKMDLEILERKPPIAPVVINGTFYALEEHEMREGNKNFRLKVSNIS